MRFIFYDNKYVVRVVFTIVYGIQKKKKNLCEVVKSPSNARRNDSNRNREAFRYNRLLGGGVRAIVSGLAW